MKRLKSWILIATSLIVSPYLAHKIQASCAHENRHFGHKHAGNCTYSQKDLTRMLEAHKERYGKHCQDQTCFYCASPIADHVE